MAETTKLTPKQRTDIEALVARGDAVVNGMREMLVEARRVLADLQAKGKTV